MLCESDGSITAQIGDLKDGGTGAEHALWERYFERLVRLARKRLRRSSNADSDEEDAVLGAFDSFCRGVKRGRFPRLNDRDDLWRILVVLTQRKVADQVRHATTQRRGGKNVQGEATFDEETGGFDQLPGREPTPAYAAMVAEEYDRRLAALNDETLRRVAVCRLEGYTGDEIAATLGCSRRAVQRKLALIRSEWRGEEF